MIKQQRLVTGALLLTAAGFAGRLIGFFYKIFLSHAIGAQGLGIYQMIFPLFFSGVCADVSPASRRL